MENAANISGMDEKTEGMAASAAINRSVGGPAAPKSAHVK
jgi:hypothetical protein